MRNLKKVLALVLALVMAMSLMVTAGATRLSDYKDSGSVTEKYVTAVDVATQLGVLRGMDDGTYAPQEILNRAQLATMIYRITTGDVTDVRTSSFAGGASVFTDTRTDQWYSGYIGFSADAGYLKGMGDGTYAPYADLTGYQVLAALLRALGYNEEGHNFCGDNWTVQVAEVALKTGMLENIGGDVDLNKGITREVAAQLIYNALFTKTVDWTLAYGYGENGKTLASDIFGIVSPKAGVPDNDSWGRPSTVWKNSDKDDVVTIAAEPIATHNVATTECQIATDLGLTGKTNPVTVYTNGVKGSDNINAVNTTDTLGAQGTLIEVYEDDLLVIIDTYLAEVTAVNEATYDKAGHLDEDAYSDITVYGLKGIGSGTLDNTNYAKATYILVNYNEATKKFEDVQAADSFVGAQTQIWYNASQHTIDGTTYDDAAHYALDGAKHDTVNYTWFLDQYGNVIGSIAIDRTGYAVLKDIIWNVGKPGYAEATLVYMDGSEATVVVDEFDGITTKGTTAGSWDAKNADKAPKLDDQAGVSFPGVSTDTKYNDLYLGYALYVVTTNDDGTVDLDSEVRGEAPVLYDQAAMIDTDSHRIIVKGGVEEVALAGNDSVNTPTNGGDIIIVDDSTEFLVNNGDGTYTPYTLATVPSFADSAKIYYTLDGDGIATRVYVKEGVEKAELGDYLYVTTNNYFTITGTADYYMSVVIDGQTRTIAASKQIVTYLSQNVGKVFAIDWALNPYTHYYGFVGDVRLVNEANDISNADGNVSEGWINYLTGSVTFGNGVIVAGEDSYRVNSDTVFVGDSSVSSSIYADNGVWVAYSSDGQQLVADVIYVGEKLDTSVALDVDSQNGTVTVDTADKTKITVAYAKGVNADELTYTADDANSVVIANTSDPVRETTTDKVNTDNADRSVIVWNEAGTDSETYSITLDWYVLDTNAKLSSLKVDTAELLSGPTAGGSKNNPVTFYLNQQNNSFTVTATAVSDKAAVQIGHGDDLAAALNDLHDGNSIIVTGSTDVNGGVVVIKVTSEAGASKYFVVDTGADPAAPTAPAASDGE